MDKEGLIKEILKLKKEKNAVIMAHNYQIPEIQDIADYLGGSLQLAKTSREIKNKLIIFCGVKFMAESIKILSPDKRIIVPEIEAGCPMADMITAENMKKIRKNYPEYSIIAYVNTNAEIKAEADICCTSANAVNIVNKIDNDKIYFVPDKNLGNWVKKNTNKTIKIWNGFCNVHNQIRKADLQEGKKNHPNALSMVHPEAPMDVLEKADRVFSTGQMVNFVKYSSKKEFLVGTEKGLLYRLQTLYPDKKFYKMGRFFVCKNMKKNTLNKLYHALNSEETEITLPDKIIKESYKAINRMFTI